MGPPPGASPPMRMTASWSGSNDPTLYKSVATKMSPLASSPRILNRQTGHRPDAELCKKPPSPATGRRTAFPAPNKELAINRKHHLTGKAPYKFESAFLQQRVCKLSVPRESSYGSKQSEASRISTTGWDRGFESPLLQRGVICEPEFSRDRSLARLRR